MIQTGFESKVKIQDIISNQLPDFVLDESPEAVDFLKQYYISQEYQGAPTDLSENLDKYLKLDNLTPDVIVDSSTTVGVVTSGADVIYVSSTKGFPKEYGLLKIDSEIITYTGISTNAFTGCIRGFSGITSYHQSLNQEELIFSTSQVNEHFDNTNVQNLSALFLKEFYQKTKKTFTPGLEGTDFNKNINVGNFIREAKSLYETKGTNKSFEILFKVLYNEVPEVLNLEDSLIKPSSANYIVRKIATAELISGNPLLLKGQSIFRSKLNDTDISASVSEVEPFNRVGIGTFFKFKLFVDDSGSIDILNNFDIIPNTRVIDPVPKGSSIITVDSTVGFDTSGIILSGINTITYTDKTVNQFLGCTATSTGSFDAPINPTDSIRSNDFYFGYENGDPSKIVKLRFTGVISDFVQTELITVDEGDIISVKSIGDKVTNPEQEKTYKQIFANSWIYNTASSYNLSPTSTSESLSFLSPLDRSSLKKGDQVELITESGTILYPTDNSEATPYVLEDIKNGDQTVTLANFGYNKSVLNTSLRRKLQKGFSTNTPIEFDNYTVTSDVQNVYFSDDNFAYVASNSLPGTNPSVDTENNYESFPYNKKIETKIIESSINIQAGTGTLTDVFDLDEQTFSTIKFNSPINFQTGDKLQYSSIGQPLSGINTGIYFAKVLNGNSIQLYASNAGVETDQFIPLGIGDGANSTHKFTLFTQKSGIIGPQKLLKKFPIPSSLGDGSKVKTIPGGTGMLINGVEINNYKSLDKVKFGPIESVSILNSGEDYDVVNEPNITISTGAGITALVQPVVSGKVKNIKIIPQTFDVEQIISIGVTGGNGSGCVLEPVIGQRFREVTFQATNFTDGGGINTSTSADNIGKIIFNEDHNFNDGETLIYDSNGNTNISIGSSDSTLSNFGSYYAEIINSKTVRLYETPEQALIGIQTSAIRFNGKFGGGTQKFKVVQKQSLLDVKVIDGGKNYTNRKLFVKPTGISTNFNTVNFKNHGFNNGDLIEYSAIAGIGSTQPTNITGLSTTKKYFVLKENDNSFQLCDGGVDGANTVNFTTKNVVGFGTTSGTGYQQFKYPDIKGTVSFIQSGISTINVSSTGVISPKTIDITPIVKGSIVDTYLYEKGTGYGSKIINLDKKPLVTVKTGKGASLQPLISNGQIETVKIDFGGNDYFSLPDLEVIDPTGKGTGAVLTPVLTNQRISNVVVSNPGIGYSTDSSIFVKSSGRNAKFDLNIRELTINDQKKLGSEQLIDTENNLKYTVSGYQPSLFGDDGEKTSGIIGWAYDGNPIYGSYGLTNPTESPSNPISGFKRLESGWKKDSTLVEDRPDGYEIGYFIEDYKFDDSTGDLDEHNGRFERTEDFPNGIYAYHAIIDDKANAVFPYFIGDSYRSLPIEENLSNLNQSNFDFNSSNVLRNTFPYKVSDRFANNDFIIETNEIENQSIEIQSTNAGSVEKLDIINDGFDYKVNEILQFDNSETKGKGLSAKVSSIKGKTINSIETTIKDFENTLITWGEDKLTFGISTSITNTLNNNDTVKISGISTNLSKINGSYKIGITTFTTNTISTISASDTLGITTEIYVSNIPESVSIGSSIKIGSETLEILNKYDGLNILRVKRGPVHYSTEYPESTTVEFLPNSFTINKKIDYFESSQKKIIFFNPAESVGLGTSIGSSYDVSFKFGNNNVSRNIPVKQIYIENHPFETNDKLNFIQFGSNTISISTDTNPGTFNLPSSNLYVVKKGQNTIGIKTGIGTDVYGNNYEEVFFRSINSANSDLYRFESTENIEVSCKVQRIQSTVSVSTSHELSEKDSITLNIKPNVNSGIGSDEKVILKRDLITGNLLINPITFEPSDIDVSANTIGISTNYLKTGDKILYSGSATGLSTGNYYVYKVEDKLIKLCQTSFDSLQPVPNVIEITGTGSSGQTISLINPEIESITNRNLIFDHTDSSMDGYEFKIYYDQEFNNEFVSTGSTSVFNVSTASSITTINYTDNLPKKLYYNLSKSGFISTSDTNVSNYSKISYVDSEYNGSFNISGIAATSFNIFLKDIPESERYTQSNCDVLEYFTNSKTAKGPINKTNIISGGSGYQKLPKFTGTGSKSSGRDAIILPKSNNIGNVSEIRIINQGFEFSSDKTLEPTAYISPIIRLKDSNTVGVVTVTFGGRNYNDPPNIVLVDRSTGKKLDKGFIQANMVENSITSVSVIEKPYGLPDDTVRVLTTNNTNGITISEVDVVSATEYNITLITPTLGFPNPPLTTNDKIFIEGIEKFGTDGSGFNSEDLGYNFLPITSIISTNPFKFKVNAVGLTTNVGIAVTIPTKFTSVVKEIDYPVLNANQVKEGFVKGETILRKVVGILTDVVSDIKITDSSTNTIKVSGIDVDSLNVNDIIIGRTSGNVATISNITNNLGRYKVNFSSTKNIGWFDDIGKLNLDTQVIPDNDYYQNLSYSVKSSIEWNELQTPVNNLLHTSGLKNFADTGITSTSNIGIGSTSVITAINDIIEAQRVDAINDLDLVSDKDVLSDGVARLIDFKNITLSDFIKCNTNDVFLIDNINKQFSNLEDNLNLFVDVLQVPNSGEYTNLLLKITNNSSVGITTQIQLSEIVVLNRDDAGVDNNQNPNVLLEKYQVINSGTEYQSFEEDRFGSFNLFKDPDTSITTLRFTPNEKFNTDYNIKVLQSSFTNFVSAASSVNIGPINSNAFIGTFASETTSEILTISTNEINSFFVNSQIVDNLTGASNFVENYVTHDGQNTYIAEAYIDSKDSSLSDSRIGILTATLSGQTLSFKYENNSPNVVTVRSRIIGFGDPDIGIGTYRFKSSDQIDGSERSLIYEGFARSGVGTTSVVDLNSSLFDGVKSLIEVNSTTGARAVHEVLSVRDSQGVYVQPAQYLSGDGNLGLGTFGGNINGSNFEVLFYPDDLVGVTTVSVFNQGFYKDFDRFNVPNSLNYGDALTEDTFFKLYNAINGERVNRKDFQLRTNNVPIFSKTFNPSSVSLSATTGTFNIDNHFFRTDEELIYTPESTVIGIGSTAIQYKSSTGAMEELPSTVFAIRENDDNFQISTTKSGTAVTFTGLGEGNRHKFTMAKRNEKSLITIDDIIQYPVSPSTVNYNLENNIGGEIGISTNIISLSGISTINADDILKIENEFVRVVDIGFGITTYGPIVPGLPETGNFSLVKVQRGSVGTSVSAHSDGTQVEKFKGSYNIVDSTVHFLDAPRGNPDVQVTSSGLLLDTSEFQGRVFLRNDYGSNLIFDDVSNSFNGITTSFTLTVGGANTIGIGTSGGNGILMINVIFQTPSTDNNPSNNFKIIESGSGATGITSVVFSGITSVGTGDIVIDPTDINNNDLPRGGIPISFGSTTGLGYAPLVGARVRAVLDGGGGITTHVGVATTGSALAISTANYNNNTGILSIRTVDEHNIKFSDPNVDEVKLVGLEFDCPPGHAGITTTIFPDGTIGDKFAIVGTGVGIGSTNEIRVNVGTSTIPHSYVGSGTAFPWYGHLTLGSGYNNIISIGVTISDPTGSNARITATPKQYNTHSFDVANSSLNNSISKNSFSGLTFTPSGATYAPDTGLLVLSFATAHGINGSDTIGIKTGSLAFRCSQDDFNSLHYYPRSTDPVAGVQTSVLSFTTNTLTVDVGKSNVNTGGALEFTVEDSGSGYTDPEIYVTLPSYENLSVRGISRVGLGSTSTTGTGLLVTPVVSASSTTGIGSGFFEFTQFNQNRSGYAFERGDVFQPVGLVTDRRLYKPYKEATVEIERVYKDDFCMWQFGELDFLDTIKGLQNGSRTRFPLKYNGLPITLKLDPELDSSLESLLLVVINGVIQEPNVAYEFIGSGSINFKEPLDPSADVALYFYKGTDSVDSFVSTGTTSIFELGDQVQIIGNSQLGGQEKRRIKSLDTESSLETIIYTGSGIDTTGTINRPIKLLKQKEDVVIDNILISKKRKNLEPIVLPTAKIIGDFTTGDNVLYLDNAELFDYEKIPAGSNLIFGNAIVSGKPIETAEISSVVSAAGTVQFLNIVNPGIGYTVGAAVSITIGAPIGVSVGNVSRDQFATAGVSTFASATVTVGAAGTIESVNITNPGLGYSQTNPPRVIIESPQSDEEIVTSADVGIVVQSTAGILTGIGTTTIGSTLGIKFIGISTITTGAGSFDAVEVGKPIYIYNTGVGAGLTSMDLTGIHTVGIGTQFVDNIYTVAEFTTRGSAPSVVGIITCAIESNTNIIGIAATAGIDSDEQVGNYSLGVLSNIVRSTSMEKRISIGVTGLTVDSGLSTFPTIQRRGINGDDTLRQTGGLETPI